MTILAFGGLGGLAGAGYFAALRREADLLVHGGGGAVAVAALRLGRVLLAVATFVAAARQGWPALLAAVLAFVAVRHIALRQRENAP